MAQSPYKLAGRASDLRQIEQTRAGARVAGALIPKGAQAFLDR
jgi:hypothetical protein